MNTAAKKTWKPSYRTPSRKTLNTIARATIATSTMGGMLLMASPATATPAGKVLICHATASKSNPYTSNDVDMSSVDDLNNADLNGHGDHSGDIIPPFTYSGVHKVKGEDVPFAVTFGGLNWDAAGQAIHGNGCAPVDDAPVDEDDDAPVDETPTRSDAPAEVTPAAAQSPTVVLSATTTPEAQPTSVVSGATSVVLPAAATIAKPASARAPRPAAVNGGVAFAADVPSTATVPSAVPAGGGSSAPQSDFPIWGIAMVAAGALAAAGAGSRLLKSDNR